MESYDVAVVGAGPGGYVAAIRAAQLGFQVALIEKRETLGGTCLNVGCIPSKSLLESSEAYHVVSHGLEDHGITVSSPQLDLRALLARKERIVSEITSGLRMLMKKNKITTLQGLGTLAAADRVQITSGDTVEEIQAKHVVLASGSESVELPFLKYDGEFIVSSTEALSFEKVPEHLVVVGAGAIGLELGSVWNRLGAEVTVIELLPRIVPLADKRTASALQKALEGQGMKIHLKAGVTGAEIQGGKARVSFKTSKGETEEITADKVLVAVGRRPYAQGLGLDKVGVELDKQGRVVVDKNYSTNIPGVYAIGDLIPGPMLAHKAEDEGVAVAEILAGKPGHVNYDAIPNVVYTWPELAEVGLNEEAAKEKGLKVKVGRSYFRANGRAKTLGEEDGLAKVIADAETDRLLGVSIVGPRASDMIAEAVTALEFKSSAEDLARICHAHPTLSEVLKEAALAVDKRSIHG